jgi:hypothetical protein
MWPASQFSKARWPIFSLSSRDWFDLWLEGNLLCKVRGYGLALLLEHEGSPPDCQGIVRRRNLVSRGESKVVAWSGLALASSTSGHRVNDASEAIPLTGLCRPVRYVLTIS